MSALRSKMLGKFDLACGKHLLVQRDRKGEENPGLYLLDPAGGPLEVIHHKPGIQTFYEFDGKLTPILGQG